MAQDDDGDDKDIVGDAVRSVAGGLSDPFKEQRSNAMSAIRGVYDKVYDKVSGAKVQAADGAKNPPPMQTKVATPPTQTKTTLKVAGPKKFTIRKRVGIGAK